MKKYKIHLTITVEDRDTANSLFMKLKADGRVSCLVPEVIDDDDKYIVVAVTFGGRDKYHYRLEKTMEVGQSRLWPTRYGMRNGTVAEIAKLTKGEIDKIYPFDKIQLIHNA